MALNTNVNTNNATVNADGLRTKYGIADWALGAGGEYRTNTSTRQTEFSIDYTTLALGTDGTHAYVLDYDVVLPAGAIIEKIEFQVGTAWASASSDVTLNFGTIQRSDFATIIDTDGLVDSLAKSVIDTENALVSISNEANATYAGALLDDVGGLTFDSVVVGYWENHVPTAGTGKLRIMWRYPST